MSNQPSKAKYPYHKTVDGLIPALARMIDGSTVKVRFLADTAKPGGDEVPQSVAAVRELVKLGEWAWRGRESRVLRVIQISRPANDPTHDPRKIEWSPGYRQTAASCEGLRASGDDMKLWTGMVQDRRFEFVSPVKLIPIRRPREVLYS